VSTDHSEQLCKGEEKSEPTSEIEGVVDLSTNFGVASLAISRGIKACPVANFTLIIIIFENFVFVSKLIIISFGLYVDTRFIPAQSNTVEGSFSLHNQAW